jgi:dihydrolipoamide dehydrogenase
VDKTKLVVIGGGPGGYPAAFTAADLGVETTIVDVEPNPGGVCVYRGCIPSKALLHAARVLAEAKEAAAFGVEFGKPRIEVEKLRAWKDSVVRKLTGGGGQLAKLRKVRWVQGRAKFLDANTLEIRKSDGMTDKLPFENAIVATGSRPATLPHLPIGPKIWDSTAALELRSVPKRLLVVGGGYIGLELGMVYAELGSRVTVVEMLPGLLPGADRDLVRPLQKRVEKLFESILLETKVASATDTAAGMKVRFEGPNGASSEQEFDALLVSVGRKPNSQDLGLEKTRVVVNARGFIEVDLQRRTAEPNIFAIGDVAGDPMLAHKATHEGRVAAEVIAGHKSAFEPQAIPAVVFTDPELAWVGLTETQAQAESRVVKISKFPWTASGRAVTLDRTDGVTKILTDPATGRLLGVGIAGPGAGELISEAALAIEMGASAADLKLTIHPHPTLSETIMEAAELVDGQATHYMQPRREPAGAR